MLTGLKHMVLFAASLFLLQCASSRPFEPCTPSDRQESSYEHVEGLPDDMSALARSSGFRQPSMIGGMTSLRNAVYELTRRNHCPARGCVVVDFVVDEYGRVVDPKTVLGLDKTCNAIAEKALSHVSFVPAFRNGQPVKIKMTQVIQFR